jgi:hypothetical protein
MPKQSKKDRSEADARKFDLLRNILPEKEVFQDFCSDILNCWESTHKLGNGEVTSSFRELDKSEIARDDVTIMLFLSTPEGEKLVEDLGIHLSRVWVLEAVDPLLPNMLQPNRERGIPIDELAKNHEALSWVAYRRDIREYFASPGKKLVAIDWSAPLGKIIEEIRYLRKSFGPKVSKKRGRQVDDEDVRIIEILNSSEELPLLKITRKAYPEVHDEDPNYSSDAKECYSKVRRTARKYNELKKKR